MEKLKSDFLRNIGAFSRAIHYIDDICFKKLNLQKGQFVFLTRICENEGICFKELSDILKVDKTTTTKAVGKLIEAGYIKKVQSSHDKREYNLYPTENAKNIYDIIISKENENIDTCFKGLSDCEIDFVCKTIKKICCNYEEVWKNEKT